MKVIVAIDQSEYWPQVIESVLRRKWPKDTQFKVLTVIAPFQWEHANPATWEKSAKEIYEARHQSAQKILTGARHMLEKGIPNAQVHVDLEQGSPRDRILRAAIEWMADKILLGAHGHSPNRLFGVVPSSVATHAPCSVELVRLHKPSPEICEEESGHKIKATV